MSTELPWELWGEVFTYVSDFRDWGRMECVCRGFQREIRRGPWTKVQNLTVRFHWADPCYHVGVKKTKEASEVDQQIRFPQVGVVRAVAERATNLKEMSISTSLFQWDDVEFEMCTDLIRSLRFSASKVLCGLTWMVYPRQPINVQFVRMLFDNPMAELINLFSGTLTEVKLTPFAMFSVCDGIGNCSSVKALTLLDISGFPNFGPEEMVAMLRNKPALKVLKLRAPNAAFSTALADGLLASGSELTELHIDCRLFRCYLDSFLADYWCSAQHLAQHPLMTVTNVSLGRFESPNNPDTFFDAFPNLNELIFPHQRTFELANFVILITIFLEKYHTMVGADPKKLHIEGYVLWKNKM